MSKLAGTIAFHHMKYTTQGMSNDRKFRLLMSHVHHPLCWLSKTVGRWLTLLLKDSMPLSPFVAQPVHDVPNVWTLLHPPAPRHHKLVFGNKTQMTHIGRVTGNCYSNRHARQHSQLLSTRKHGDRFPSP